MENAKYMFIDGMPVAIEGEKNLLELIRKAGIDLPTFCYYTELSVYGACRLCMVENKWGGIDAACSTPPKAGSEVFTNTEKLRKHRKMILELILSHHCRDCTTCQKNGSCKLQELAMRFGIERVRFQNTAPEPELDESSPAIVRDRSKCILCGDCVRMCDEVQAVGAINFAHRGSNLVIATAFDKPIAQSTCVGCGQCAAVCPTGAIVVRDDRKRVWAALSDKSARVVAQIAPAVRVAVGKAFGIKDGENALGRIAAALRRMGFDEVFDTATGADLTVLEESAELLSRLESGERLPLFTSCCPSWVQYVERFHPELMPNVSTCRSPMQMFASIIKDQPASAGRRIVHVAVMPCTAKKAEAVREEFTKDGVPMVDVVITTQELIQMIRESGLIYPELEPEAVDAPYSSMTGAGVIFGVTGGVTEAVIRRLMPDKSARAMQEIAFRDVRGMKGIKETTLDYGDRTLKIAIVSGLGNAEALIQRIQAGEHYDFVEVMACPGGCVAGAGQPFGTFGDKAARGKALYSADRQITIRRSEENPLMRTLYSETLKGRVHEMLHVHYAPREEESHDHD